MITNKVKGGKEGRRGKEGGEGEEGRGSQISVTHLFDESKVLRECSHSIEPANHTQGYISLTIHLGAD